MKAWKVPLAIDLDRLSVPCGTRVGEALEQRNDLRGVIGCSLHLALNKKEGTHEFIQDYEHHCWLMDKRGRVWETSSSQVAASKEKDYELVDEPATSVGLVVKERRKQVNCWKLAIRGQFRTDATAIYLPGWVPGLRTKSKLNGVEMSEKELARYVVVWQTMACWCWADGGWNAEQWKESQRVVRKVMSSDRPVLMELAATAGRSLQTS